MSGVECDRQRRVRRVRRVDGEDVPVGTGRIDGTGYSIGSSGGSSPYVFEDGAVTCDCSASSEPRPEVIADEVRAASCWFCPSWPSIDFGDPSHAVGQYKIAARRGMSEHDECDVKSRSTTPHNRGERSERGVFV